MSFRFPFSINRTSEKTERNARNQKCSVFRESTVLPYRFIPESFRWLITTGKYAESEEIIGRVAKMNGHEKPDIRNIIEQAKQDEKQETKRYTAIDLFRTKRSAIKTLALMFTWCVYSASYACHVAI